MQNLEPENLALRQACAAVKTELLRANRLLDDALCDLTLKAETPLEVRAAMDSAAAVTNPALHTPNVAAPAAPAAPAASPRNPNAPTRQQGQFLAFIHAYMTLRHGHAPSHADFQQYFNLTPPSVNSMLIRLEERGFIKRVRGQARAIELVISPDTLPKLERPLRR
ncbi:hypothetical protein LBMAG56_10350 [Verrucomicrobiota bacterium]|nr:hypothetical protein LBMAG56_10350 [Verrucomicrobiota bacterium]